MRRDWNHVPKEIQEHGLDFHWDNQKVWSLDMSVEEMDISEIEWMTELPFWWKDAAGNTFAAVSPKDAMRNLDLYPNHRDRIMNADTSYPIDIMKNHNDRWLILDGLHRLMQLIAKGERKIKVRKIPREMIPLIER